MNAFRKILASIKRADSSFNLIENGDRIVVGLSGGKDSFVLLLALLKYRRYTHKDCQLFPVTLDLGFPEFDSESLVKKVEQLGLQLQVVDARNVYPILIKNQKNNKPLPCSICSRMKKAIINQTAKKLNANKVAFAHHNDDAIETLFMNMIYGGRIDTFAPKMELTRDDIIFIRPLVLIDEMTIIQASNQLDLPIIDSPCPTESLTARYKIKNTLNEIYRHYPDAKSNFSSMINRQYPPSVFYAARQYQIENTPLLIKPVLSFYEGMEAFKIRQKVFVEEQNVSSSIEFDGSDQNAYLFLLMLDNQPIGTIRYIELEAGIYKLGRIAIIKKYRGRGYGKAMITWLHDYIKKQRVPATLIIHAQLYLAEYYESFGYQRVGQVFQEADIDHIKMVLILK
jgi:tRNA 2-thiocytidine biosynthesis protein TtcA